MSTPVSTSSSKSRDGASRVQDPEGTKQNIIEVAAQEFALNGLSGARIDEIAAKTRSSKRMIYYYFGSKEGLYVSALENAYRQVRGGEAKLDIEGLPPLDAFLRPVLAAAVVLRHRRHARRQDDPGLLAFCEDVDVGRAGIGVFQRADAHEAELRAGA